MGRLFGTDGIRGIANENLDCALAYKVGMAAATALSESARHRAVIYIGKDTRISSDMLEAALVAGVTAAGADAVLLGVAPTPAVAFLTASHADAGVVISASHNPFQYNGIKIFNSEGFKLSDEIEDRIEALIGSGLTAKIGDAIGRVRHSEDMTGEYVEYVRSVAEGSFGRLKVAVDCANGAASRTARALFGPMSFKKLTIFGDEPDGLNINEGCGSTSLDRLRATVTEGGYDIGIAFDGDADRCLAVDEKGNVIDGDRMMAVCGLHEMNQGHLPENTIVATVMSNLGFHVWARENGVKLVTAQVGDRYVLERMRRDGYMLGGEQSGHLIFLRHATTGDGQLSAVKFLSILAENNMPASELVGDIPQYPQVLVNVEVSAEAKKSLAEDPEVMRAVSEVEAVLGETGRVLVRPSGTENLVRVMIEGKDEAQIYDLAKKIALIIENLH